MIPEDWEVGTLTSVSQESMQNGVFFEPARKGKGIRLINVGDLYTNVPINIDSLELFDATQTECERFRVADGDIFFTRSSVVPSGIAQCNIYRNNRDEPAVFDSHVIRLRPDIRKVIPAYLFRFCVSSIARHYLVSHAKTGTMTTIDQTVLGMCPVVLPPLAEQEAIAAALSDADALIEALEQLIAKKRQVKQGAMQELLTGKRRLPGFSGEWEVKRLSEMAELKNGYAFKSSTYTPLGHFNIVTIANVQDGYMDLAACNKVDTLPDDLQPHHRLQFGDTLISMTGNVGRVCRVSEASCLLNQRVGKMVPSGYDSDFLFVLLSQRRFLVAMAGKAKGGAQGNLSVPDIMEFQFAIPPTKSEQTSIAAILSDVDAEIAALEEKLAKARQVKQGMMQMLLTGKVRLV